MEPNTLSSTGSGSGSGEGVSDGLGVGEADGDGEALSDAGGLEGGAVSFLLQADRITVRSSMLAISAEKTRDL